MHTFTDTKQRIWTIDIQVDALRRVRGLMSINLVDALEGDLLPRLVSDPIFLCDVLFALCQPEARERNISDEEFGRSLGGDALDQATSALLEELADFFPPEKRTLFRKALEKLHRLQTIALETATHKLESGELEQKMTAALAATSGD